MTRGELELVTVKGLRKLAGEQGLGNGAWRIAASKLDLISALLGETNAPSRPAFLDAAASEHTSLAEAIAKALEPVLERLVRDLLANSPESAGILPAVTESKEGDTRTSPKPRSAPIKAMKRQKFPPIGGNPLPHCKSAEQALEKLKAQCKRDGVTLVAQGTDEKARQVFGIVEFPSAKYTFEIGNWKCAPCGESFDKGHARHMKGTDIVCFDCYRKP